MLLLEHYQTGNSPSIRFQLEHKTTIAAWHACSCFTVSPGSWHVQHEASDPWEDELRAMERLSAQMEIEAIHTRGLQYISKEYLVRESILLRCINESLTTPIAAQTGPATPYRGLAHVRRVGGPHQLWRSSETQFRGPI